MDVLTPGGATEGQAMPADVGTIGRRIVWVAAMAAAAHLAEPVSAAVGEVPTGDGGASRANGPSCQVPGG